MHSKAFFILATTFLTVGDVALSLPISQVDQNYQTETNDPALDARSLGGLKKAAGTVGDVAGVATGTFGIANGLGLFGRELEDLNEEDLHELHDDNTELVARKIGAGKIAGGASTGLGAVASGLGIVNGLGIMPVKRAFEDEAEYKPRFVSRKVGAGKVLGGASTGLGAAVVGLGIANGLGIVKKDLEGETEYGPQFVGRKVGVGKIAGGAATGLGAAASGLGIANGLGIMPVKRAIPDPTGQKEQDGLYVELYGRGLEDGNDIFAIEGRNEHEEESLMNLD